MSDFIPSPVMVAWIQANYADDVETTEIRRVLYGAVEFFADPKNAEDTKAFAEATMERQNSYGLFSGTAYRVKGESA